jgi:hypothetical protein
LPPRRITAPVATMNASAASSITASEGAWTVPVMWSESLAPCDVEHGEASEQPDDLLVTCRSGRLVLMIGLAILGDPWRLPLAIVDGRSAKTRPQQSRVWQRFGADPRAFECLSLGPLPGWLARLGGQARCSNSGLGDRYAGG